MKTNRFHLRLLPHDRQILAYIARHLPGKKKSAMVREAVAFLDHLRSLEAAGCRFFFSHRDLEQRYELALANGPSDVPDLDAVKEGTQATDSPGVTNLQLRLGEEDKGRLDRLMGYFHFASHTAAVRDALILYHEALSRYWREWKLEAETPKGEVLPVMQFPDLAQPSVEKVRLERGALQPMLEGSKVVRARRGGTAAAAPSPTGEAAGEPPLEDAAHLAPAAEYVTRLVRAQDQYGARVSAVALPDQRERFWNDPIADRIWRSAAPESMRVFVLEGVPQFREYYASLVRHASAYHVFVTLREALPDDLRARLRDFAIIDAEGDRLLATYGGEGADAQISFTRSPSRLGYFTSQFRLVRERAVKVFRGDTLSDLEVKLGAEVRPQHG